MALLACFSGRIGSGKSSISEALSERIGWHRTSFSDYLRAELRRQGGDASSREALQNLGQAMVEADQEAFCRNVLAAGGFQPGNNFLLEGIRHVEIYEVLTKLASPSFTKLIFLSADDESRFVRVGERADGQADFARAEAHKVEADTKDRLPLIADFCIDTTLGFDVVLDRCLSVIRCWHEG